LFFWAIIAWLFVFMLWLNTGYHSKFFLIQKYIMKRAKLLLLALMFVVTISKAQTTAMQFTGQDCEGNNVDLFADLDAGKAVILFYYMPNCGTCPPPAKKIQAMAANINAMYPGKVKGYAFPFQNSTTCTYSQSWVSSNSLSTLYSPMDSGAEQLAHYGGFGMPTVVLVGGADHKVLFSTLSFATSDTIEMRNKIMALIGGSTGINDLPLALNAFNVYPNPAVNQFSVDIDLKERADVLIDVADITGKQVVVLMEEQQSGLVSRQFNTDRLPDGMYFLRLQVNGQTTTKKLNIIH
jgi:hypothetical protein